MVNLEAPLPSHFSQVGSSSSIELWLADLESVAANMEEISSQHPLLSKEEAREFIGSENIPRLRMRRTARMVLRFLLKVFFGPSVGLKKFEIGPYGKPNLPGLRGDFNLAHAGGYALIGLGEVSAIGVDIEPVREVRLSPSRRSALIAAALGVSGGKSLPETEDFKTLQAWTRLEALAKAEGQGIGRILGRFGIWGSSRGLTGIPYEENRSLLVHDLPVGHINMLASVCLPNGIDLPKMQTLPIQLEELLGILLRKPQPSMKSGVDLHKMSRQNTMVRSVAQPG